MGIHANGIRGRAGMVLRDISSRDMNYSLLAMENITPGPGCSSLGLSQVVYFNATEFLFGDSFLCPIFLVEHLLYAKLVFFSDNI